MSSAALAATAAVVTAGAAGVAASRGTLRLGDWVWGGAASGDDVSTKVTPTEPRQASTWREARRYETGADGHDGDEYGRFAVSRDGRTLAVGAPLKSLGGDTQTGALYLYRCPGASACRPDQGVTFRMRGAAEHFGRDARLSDDGETALVTSSSRVELYRHRAATGRWHRVFSAPYSGDAVALHPDGTRFALSAGEEGREVQLYAFLSGNLRVRRHTRLLGLDGTVRALSMGPEGTAFSTGQSVELWSAGRRARLCAGAASDLAQAGGTVAVGQAEHDDFRGRVTLFERGDPARPGAVRTVHVLPPNDQFGTRSRFGASVSLRDGVLAVGAPGADRVYLYTRGDEQGGGGDWTLDAIVRSPAAAAGAEAPVWGEFGHTVSLANGQTLVAACSTARAERPESGCVYVFRRAK